MRRIFYVNAGNITAEESARNALAQWANDCERRLLGMTCGYVLPRERHKVWAEGALKHVEIKHVEDGWGYGYAYA